MDHSKEGGSPFSHGLPSAEKKCVARVIPLHVILYRAFLYRYVYTVSREWRSHDKRMVHTMTRMVFTFYCNMQNVNGHRGFQSGDFTVISIRWHNNIISDPIVTTVIVTVLRRIFHFRFWTLQTFVILWTVYLTVELHSILK